MAQRLVTLYLPDGDPGVVRKAIDGMDLLGQWSKPLAGGVLEVTILLEVESSEAVLDQLANRFSWQGDYRIVVLPVEASLPRGEERGSEPPPGPGRQRRGNRISREELYADIAETVRLSPVYLVMVALSAVVAAFGLLRENVAVIIGAMVLAPLLGPNIALALATTLADGTLARRAARANLLGAGLALILALAAGLLFEVDPVNPEIHARTRVGLADIGLALAAGVAGALSFTAGVSTAIIGVMVAVALLPPLVTLGLVVGAGLWDSAQGAALLLLSNIICVNLAGVATFLLQGIRPATWWEVRRARRAVRIAIVVWALLLAVLVAIVLFTTPFGL